MNIRVALDDVGAPKNTARAEWLKTRRAETSFGVQLRKVAKHISDIVKGFDVSDMAGQVFLQAALRDYAQLIGPWARSVANRMIAEVDARDKAAWAKVASIMGLELSAEINSAPVQQAMSDLAATQVQLITSLPTDAALKLHEWTQAGIIQGERPETVAKRIYSEIGGVTRARASTIARTEVARTGTELLKIRAKSVGSTHFEWISARDFIGKTIAQKARWTHIRL